MTRSPASRFPRPTTSFVGRDAELERANELLRSETVSLIYGVGGVGKTEFVFKWVDELRASEWKDARLIHVEVPVNIAYPQFLALLRSRLHPTGSPSASPRTNAPITRLVDEVVALLESDRHLLFIDNAHQLGAAEAAEFLAHLSRHVRSSRIIVASRAEIAAARTASLSIIRLGPLDRDSTEAMVRGIAHRLGIESPDADRIYQSSRGSPFYIQRELVDAHHLDGEFTDSLTRTVADLGPDERRLLLVAALAKNRLSVEDLTESNGRRTLDALEARFLVTGKDAAIAVHDLVREAVFRIASTKEFSKAATAAATALVKTGDPPAMIDAVSALIDAGQSVRAWEIVESTYRTIAYVGLDGLLLAPLQTLYQALPMQAGDIELLIAHILVRRGQLEQATVHLKRLAIDPSVAETSGFLLISGEVAQRSGNLSDAADYFERALRAASTDNNRVRAACLASVALALRADFDGARRNIDAARAALPKNSLSSLARVYWADSSVNVLEGRFVEALALASESRAQLANAPDDLVVRIALTETIACVESDQIARAVDWQKNAMATGERFGPLRASYTELYRGIIEFGRGDLRAAESYLTGAVNWFRDSGDFVNSCVASYNLTEALLAQGALDRGNDFIREAIATAEAARAPVFVCLGYTIQSQLALEHRGPVVAQALARKALSQPRLPPVPIVRARCALAAALALAGQHDGATTELDRAAEVVPDGAIATERRLRFWRAYCAMLAGDYGEAISTGRGVADEYRSCERQFDELRTSLIVALAHLCRDDPGDKDIAAAIVADVTERTAESQLDWLSGHSTILCAALATRSGDRETARRILIGALRIRGLHRTDMLARQLRAAVGQSADEPLPVALHALLARLGLTQLRQFELVSRTSRQLLSASEAAALPTDRSGALIIDLDKTSITGPLADGVTGRPVMCRLLAALVNAGNRTVNAETLFHAVWGGDDYHSLRDGNKLYVTLSRLRKLLRSVIGDVEVIETVADGWRLADGVDACVLRGL